MGQPAIPRLRGNNANLWSPAATAPLMRWLIAAALDNATVTYGEAKARLETEENFATIFAVKMGGPAGALITRLHEIDPEAPLINVILVSQADRLPSDGAGSFMADRFDMPVLRQENARTRFPKRWRAAFDRAAQEVYSYGEEQWSTLYERAFGVPLPLDTIAEDRRRRKSGTERDGQPGGRGGGEGPNHRALRLWVRDHPHLVRRRLTGARADTEVELDSADRVDVVFYGLEETVVVEVKSRDSDRADHLRGVYQCIKYRAVQAAMDVRDKPNVQALLVTETPPSGEIRALLRRHDIAYFQAPLDR